MTARLSPFQRRHRSGSALRAPGCALALLFLLLSCRDLAEASLTPEEASLPPIGEVPYLVTQGDTLELRFEFDASLNADVVVRNDGCGTAPLVGDLPFAGRTMPEAAAMLRERYASRLRHAGVDVLLKVMHPERVFVGGAVAHPGMIPLDRRSMTLLQCVHAAGGPEFATARLDHVVLCRLVPDGRQRAFKVDLARAAAGDVEHPVFARDGAVSLVPPSAITDANRFVAQWFDGLMPGSTLVPAVLLRGGLGGN